MDTTLELWLICFGVMGVGGLVVAMVQRLAGTRDNRRTEPNE